MMNSDTNFDLDQLRNLLSCSEGWSCAGIKTEICEYWHYRGIYGEATAILPLNNEAPDSQLRIAELQKAWLFSQGIIDFSDNILMVENKDRIRKIARKPNFRGVGLIEYAFNQRVEQLGRELNQASETREQIDSIKPRLKDFICAERGVPIRLKQGGLDFDLYLRNSQRLIRVSANEEEQYFKAITIASISVEPTGYGIGTDLINWIHSSHDKELTYIESVCNPALDYWLKRNGWIVDSLSFDQKLEGSLLGRSYFKMKEA